MACWAALRGDRGRARAAVRSSRFAVLGIGPIITLAGGPLMGNIGSHVWTLPPGRRRHQASRVADCWRPTGKQKPGETGISRQGPPVSVPRLSFGHRRRSLRCQFVPTARCAAHVYPRPVVHSRAPLPKAPDSKGHRRPALMRPIPGSARLCRMSRFYHWQQAAAEDVHQIVGDVLRTPVPLSIPAQNTPPAFAREAPIVGDGRYCSAGPSVAGN